MRRSRGGRIRPSGRTGAGSAPRAISELCSRMSASTASPSRPMRSSVAAWSTMRCSRPCDAAPPKAPRCGPGSPSTGDARSLVLRSSIAPPLGSWYLPAGSPVSRAREERGGLGLFCRGLAIPLEFLLQAEPHVGLVAGFVAHLEAGSADARVEPHVVAAVGPLVHEHPPLAERLHRGQLRGVSAECISKPAAIRPSSFACAYRIAWEGDFARDIGRAAEAGVRKQFAISVELRPLRSPYRRG